MTILVLIALLTERKNSINEVLRKNIRRGFFDEKNIDEFIQQGSGHNTVSFEFILFKFEIKPLIKFTKF